LLAFRGPAWKRTSDWEDRSEFPPRLVGEFDQNDGNFRIYNTISSLLKVLTCASGFLAGAFEKRRCRKNAGLRQNFSVCALLRRKQQTIREESLTSLEGAKKHALGTRNNDQVGV
jgi:hypothetical protein